MPRGVSEKTKKLTLSAACAALGVLILTVGSLVEVLDLSAAALSGMIVIFATIELGRGWGWGVYFATGFLSLLLPVKLPAVFYILFCGWYPIAKERIEGKLGRGLGWIVKVVLFCLSFAAIGAVSLWVLNLPADTPTAAAILFLLSLGAFVLLDVAMTRLITFYLFRLRSRLGIDRLLK